MAVRPFSKTNVGPGRLARVCRTVAAHRLVAGGGFDTVRRPNHIRETVNASLAYFGSSNSTGHGSVTPDLHLFNYIRHGIMIPGMEGLPNHGIAGTPLHRLIAVMSHAGHKWGVTKSNGVYELAREDVISEAGHNIASVMHIFGIDGCYPGLEGTHYDALREELRLMCSDMWIAFDSTANAHVTPPAQENTVQPAPNNPSISVPSSAADIFTALTNTTNATTPVPEKPVPNPSVDLGAMNFDQIMASLNQVPALVRENGSLKTRIVSAMHELAEANVFRGKAESDAKAALTSALASEAELNRVRAELQKVKASGGGTVTKIAVDDHTISTKAGNDLDEIALKLGITRKELDDKMTAFKLSCAINLSNAPDWQPWCDPTKPMSPASLMYRMNLPFVATGPSGTGKTFLLEALCLENAGCRCLISYHESLTYSKLFLKERVASGRTYWELGPVPMAMLCGVPTVNDEFDHSDPAVQSLAHGIIDSRQLVLNEIGVLIKPADGFRMLFTCNSLSDGDGDYEGEVATALRTRFGATFVGYPDLSTETKTITVASGIDAANANRIARGFHALRQAERDNKITGPFSTREACSIAKLTRMACDEGASPVDALAAAFKLYVTDKRPREEQVVAAETLMQAIGTDTGTTGTSGGFMDSLTK